ncbi:UNVERIFIED_CONTAM: hypothetical protein Sangu_1582500 [Sesamum angustifolium]|uniref:Uncharacterized protein n=1 Tax=Sesamum angustifolium TaxID=2727405 RepID=A0AAW2MTH7_9LAMI
MQHDCHSLIDERLLGYFGLSPRLEPLGESSKVYAGSCSGRPGGGTSPPHSPMGTPTSSDSKGKRQASPMAEVTLGISSKKARLSSFGTPTSSSRPHSTPLIRKI